MNARLLELAFKGSLADVREAVLNGADVDCVGMQVVHAVGSLNCLLFRREWGNSVDVRLLFVVVCVDRFQHRWGAPVTTMMQTQLCASCRHEVLQCCTAPSGRPRPFTFVARWSNAAVVSLLLEAKSPVDPVDKDVTTPLHWSCRREDNTDVAALLLDHGAQINCQGFYRYTALHVAAGSGSADLVALLLSRGADITATDEGDQTVLMRACVNRSDGVPIIRQLINAGVDVTLWTMMGTMRLCSA